MLRAAKDVREKMFVLLIPASKTLADQFARLDVHYFFLSRS